MTEIKLSGDNALRVYDDIANKGRVVVVAKNAGGNYIGVSATPPEWDAFVAAGNAALGRPAPASTPLASRIASEQGPPVDLSGICSEGREEDVYGMGYAKGRADAAAMVREAGPTVPRGAVAAVVPLLAGVSTMLADSDDAEAKREAVRRLDRIIVALGRMVTDGPTEGR